MKNRSLFLRLIKRGIIPVMAATFAFSPLGVQANEGEGGLQQTPESSQNNESGGGSGSAEGQSQENTSGGSTTPTEGTPTSSEGTQTSSEGTANLSAGTQTSSEETAYLSAGTATPSEGTATPAEGTTTPAEGVSAPATDPSESEDSEKPMGQASALDQIMSAPPEVYNQALAEIAAELSNKAYGAGGTAVADYLVGYGFDRSNIESYNYDKSYAYTLAVKDYFNENTDNTKILVMDARGSVTSDELAGDALSKPEVNYDGYMVYTIVDTFYKEIEKNLDKFLNAGSDYKILSTGHSLGGAVANLFAALQTKKGDAQVYGYTFGAIDSIKSPEPGKSVEEGYENIHNIYNDWDTFSPMDQGYVLKGGAGSKYGKFGHMDSYAIDRRTEAQKKDWPWNKVRDHVNHNMDYYVTDTYNKAFSCPEGYGGDDGYKGEEPAPSAPAETTPAAAQPAIQTAPQTIPQPVQPAADFVLSKDVAEVVHSLYTGKNVNSVVTAIDGAFSDHMKMLASTIGAEIIYNTAAQVVGVNEISLQNLTTMRDNQGKIMVVMEIANTSDRNIYVGADSVISNDQSINSANWKSQVIAPGQRIMVAISLSDIAGTSAKASIPLNIFAADGTRLSTTRAINVTP
ncbi:MAG: hypothetical protein IJU77_03350 [Butyrivibrio sp.]|nr:hypothetical protein [Butyrivibrio sp.]